MRKQKKLSDSEILGILSNQISNASGGYNSNLDHEKGQNLDYYYGDESLIDAEEGESSIITREVLENVERELGSQLKVFSAGERVVQFDPTGAEDEEQAEQETDYVNYIYNKENDGFKISHDWIKSALIERNAYVKVWVEEKEEIETQTYTGLNDVDFATILSQENIEPLEHEEVPMIDPMSGVPYLAHDIKVRITNTEKKIRVECVPGEEIGVARNHNQLSLKECPFVFHRPCNITASDLIESGFDRALVETLPRYNESQNELENARDNNTSDNSDLYDEADDSTRIIEVYECYLRLDFDGDGISELRKITIAGDTVLDNEEIDFIPFATLCPLPMPNKHEGLSYADMIKDLQDVNTVLMQQILTNLYFTNMPQLEVVDNNQNVNLDDLLINKSGSIKRVKTPGSINPITIPFTAGQSLPILEVLDSMAERRVGRSQPLDPNVLAKTTGAAYIAGMEKDNQLSEKLARIFAETGFKELFMMIHELAIKHKDKAQVLKLRNDYVEIDPTEWKHRSNMSVVVGLGTGNRAQEIGQLMALAEKQEEHLLQGSPLVTLKNLHNTYSRVVERSGLKEPSLYFTDPESPEAQQAAQEKAQQAEGEQNPLAEAEAIKGQFAIQKTQIEVEMKGQLEQFKQQSEFEKQTMKAQYDAELQALKTALDDRARELDRQSQEGIEILRAEVELLKAGQKQDIGQPGTGAELNG